jgi:hypothetical protein
MSADRFHVLLSCARWPTLYDMVSHYLCRHNIHYETVSPSLFALFNEKGRIGSFLVREKKGRLAFGYFES